jgi:hypothetical protein
LPNAVASSTAPTSSDRCQAGTSSSVRGSNCPATIRNPDANAALTRCVQSGAGRQSASVRASRSAPCSTAYRIPVSAAAPVPFSGSRTKWTQARVRPNSATTQAVASVEPLSTTTRLKSESRCAAIASSVAVMPLASL